MLDERIEGRHVEIRSERMPVADLQGTRTSTVKFVMVHLSHMQKFVRTHLCLTFVVKQLELKWNTLSNNVLDLM